MRVGIFKDRHGANYDITQNVLDALARTFNPSKPPHLLVGHPDGKNAPSFGIVEALKVVGDKLLFKPGKVCAEFAALVRRGGFPSVSAGLTHDLSRLDHVAFLSAQKPAIDGFAPIAEFSASPDNPTDALDVTDPAAEGMAEFASIPDWWVTDRIKSIANLLRGVKNDIIERKGAEAADALLPESSITFLQADPPVEEETTPEFTASIEDKALASNAINETDGNVSDADKYNDLLPKYKAAQDSLAEMTAAVQKSTTENDMLKDEIDVLKKKIRLAEFAEFVEGCIADGRVLPDQKQRIVDNMETLFNNPPPVEFSNGEKPSSALSVYKVDLMCRARVAPKEGAMPPRPEFAAQAAGCNDPYVLGKKARDYQDEMAAKGVRINHIDALEHVKQN